MQAGVMMSMGNKKVVKIACRPVGLHIRKPEPFAPPRKAIPPECPEPLKPKVRAQFLACSCDGSEGHVSVCWDWDVKLESKCDP